MFEIIKKAIDIFAAESSQINLSSDASRESLAEFINKYVIDEYSEPNDEMNGVCCGNNCDC